MEVNKNNNKNNNFVLPSPSSTKTSRKHVLAYLDLWFKAKVRELRKQHGLLYIRQHDVQDLANDIMDRFEEGEESFVLDFRPSGAKPCPDIQVAISSPGILSLQQIDPSSPGFRVVCKGLIDDTMKKIASGQPLLKRTEPTSQYKTFIVGNEHCFTLPFRSTNRCFLSCDEHSSVIRTHRGGSNGDSCTSKYFENSLHDTIGKDLIIINAMDVNTLMPDRWLNDAIVNFWIKWVSVPRSPNDLAAKVHVFSSHFLSSVLTAFRHHPISIDPTPRIDSIDSYELIGRFGIINSLLILCLYLPNKWSTFFIRPTHTPDLI